MMSVLICLVAALNAGMSSALSVEVKSTDCPTISAAVAACSEKGGGKVVVPKGVYELNGPIHLKSNVELRLEEGAKLVFADDWKAYLPAVRTSWEGVESMGFSPLIYACGCTNVAVTGKGLLAPRVEGWVPWRTPKGMGAARKTQRGWALRAVTLRCDPDYPARNFRLENVVIDEVFENFARVENVDGIKLDVTARKIHPDAHW